VLPGVPGAPESASTCWILPFAQTSRPTGHTTRASTRTHATSPTTRPLRTRKPPPEVRGVPVPDGGRPPPGPPGRAGAGWATPGRPRVEGTAACALARGEEEMRAGAAVERCGARAGATDGGRADAAASGRARVPRAGGAGGGVPRRDGVTGISRDDWRRMRGSARTASLGPGRGRCGARPAFPTAIASSTDAGRGERPP